jgi:hypothetical protein
LRNDNVTGMADTSRNETGPRAPTPSDCYSDFIAYKRRVETATRKFCTCGGMGPEDAGVCPACLVALAVRK